MPKPQERETDDFFHCLALFPCYRGAGGPGHMEPGAGDSCDQPNGGPQSMRLGTDRDFGHVLEFGR